MQSGFSVAELVLLLNAASALFMVGLIWMIQIVHYPLFSVVPPDRFGTFHRRHSRRIAWLVIPAMSIEAVTTVSLLKWRPASVEFPLVLAGVVAVVTVWLLTIFVQVPQHQNLARGYDDATINALIRFNWLRTTTWTFHGAIVIAMLAQVV
ncbi:hypothetical protein BH23CHL5_BH23CHL5_09530 [soil metagenome]